MATTNHDRVGKAMELLRDGLAPFVQREVTAKSKARAVRIESIRRFAEDPMLVDKPISDWDASGLLRLMWETWNEVFRDTLGFAERSLVSELREWRNKWAHQERFSSDDADRALDSVERLLTAVSASEADEVARMKTALRRLVFEEQVRTEKRRTASSMIEAAEAVGVGTKPWREVVMPHADVASGRYQQAEFAADLWQVYQGQGSPEYRDAEEFFRRTFLTDSLKRLLVGAMQRLAGEGGDPVVQLQTNFGGGKTHSMLALYHLFSGTPPNALLGMDEVLAEADVRDLPSVRRVVLVGNRISPGNPTTKADGAVVRTLWGELAYQLGGREAYERIRADDENATNPGDALQGLFEDYGPCLLLIDEWVSYARQLHDGSDLPAGSFETQFTFAQALTEQAKSKRCLVVISLPASHSPSESSDVEVDNAEVGGIRGHEALDRLRNAVGRVDTPWRPASALESFEIVRRRLFEPIVAPAAFTQRDVAARAFADLYRGQRLEFPPECSSLDYEQRARAAYPIHPEVFDRLYTDWSALAKFQRTRGVLRLMAAVIHSLWEQGDRNPLIMPSTIPIDDPRVQNELTRYLPENWSPVIEKDVDGPNSLPRQIDRAAPNLGKLSATRRVARTVYLGSAPTTAAAHRGIDDARIKLGCTMPGETPAAFGDALRRLAASATYLYQDGARVWYATQPTVTKLAEDRAEELRRKPDAALGELERRLKMDLRARGDFERIHTLPRASADIPDDLDARLVVLPADAPHSAEPGSAAEAAAKEILEHRGNTPRLYRNALVFLAVDKVRWQDLDESLRRFLAWDSILKERNELNLDPHQTSQAETQLRAADETVAVRLPEAYQWLLAPEQPSADVPMTWAATKLSGSGGLAERATKRLRNDELLLRTFGATILRKHMDDVPLWRENHVEVRELVAFFAQYVYLPRLAGPQVLMDTIQNGVSSLTWEADTFALAEGYDQASKRYLGLQTGRLVSVVPESPALLVRSTVARDQLRAETPESPHPDRPDGPKPDPEPFPDGPEPPEPTPKLRRFHGAVTLNATRVGLDASQIADEVIAHVAGLVDADVRVTLEIDAEIPDGAPENVVRTVTENCRTLKFDSHGFDES